MIRRPRPLSKKHRADVAAIRQRIANGAVLCSEAASLEGGLRYWLEPGGDIVHGSLAREVIRDLEPCAQGLFGQAMQWRARAA